MRQSCSTFLDQNLIPHELDYAPTSQLQATVRPRRYARPALKGFRRKPHARDDSTASQCRTSCLFGCLNGSFRVPAIWLWLLCLFAFLPAATACSQRNGLSLYQLDELSLMTLSIPRDFGVGHSVTPLAVSQSSTQSSGIPTRVPVRTGESSARDERRIYARSSSTNSTASSSSTIPSTLSATGTSTTFTLPRPFDTTLGDNFTETNCPTFLERMLNDSSFISCYPVSLLLQACLALTPLTSRATMLTSGFADIDFFL